MKNVKIKYINDYIDYFSSTVLNLKSQKEKIEKIFKILTKYQKKNAVHIFGNGGSASIASHFSMDLTNNSKIKCFSYNDTSTITCYSNDFKFENWISRVIEKYTNKNDLLILISSSGKSKNMINAVATAKRKKFYKIITLTGFDSKNPLKQKGDLNIWVNSKSYNMIENTHQFILLLLVDMIKKLKK